MTGKSSIEIRKKALEQDYKPLVVDGINKVLEGETNMDAKMRRIGKVQDAIMKATVTGKFNLSTFRGLGSFIDKVEGIPI